MPTNPYLRPKQQQNPYGIFPNQQPQSVNYGAGTFGNMSANLGRTRDSVLEYAMQEQAAKKAAAQEREKGYAALTEQANFASDPALLQRYYAEAMGLFGQNAASQAARSRSSAAAMASQRGLANPSGFVSAVGNQAMAPYQKAQGEAGVQQAEAMTKLQEKKFQMLYLIDRARNGDKDAEARLALEQRRLQAAIDGGDAGVMDWLGLGLDVGAAILSGGATIPLSVLRRAGQYGANNNVDPEYVTRPFSLQG